MKIKNKYKYGFSDDNSLDSFSFVKGLSEDVIRKISSIKNEPKWMLDFRLKSFEIFNNLPNPKWGPDLSFINFDEYIYYSSLKSGMKTKWEEVPQKIKDTFKKLNVNEEDAKYLSGVNEQYDSETVYHNLKKELDDKKIIFTNLENAVQHHPELVKKYFSKLIPPTDNKYAALNSAVWSGGSFIYIPPNVHLDKPLQAYFRINTKSIGQFERTLIILDENSKAHYTEGCTAPVYDSSNLHAAVVEVFVGKNAICRYSTIQNWSDNVFNLVTKRARVDSHGSMEWVDGNLGSKLNMKYPSTILFGEYSRGKTTSISIAHNDVIQDTGAKMIHIAPHTHSQIISKSIAHSGGISNYRGSVIIGPNAHNSYSDVTCDTLLVDSKSHSDTIPRGTISNTTSFIKHEATTTDLDKEIMFYLNSRGITDSEAKHLIVMGFVQPFSDELPMEYAVELSRLLKFDLCND